MQGVEQGGGDSPTMPSGSIDPVTDGILVDIDDTAGTPQRITFCQGPHRDRVIRLLRVHPLRMADAFQLAAAIVAAENHPASLQFVTLDDRLGQAAEREGFTFPRPDQEPATAPS